MDARSTMIDKQCQHHLTIAGYGTTLFWSRRWRMFPLLTHAFSLWNIVQTPGLVLWQYDPKTHLPLFHTTAYVPGRYPCKFPSVCCLHSSAPILQKLSNTPELVCWCDAPVTHWFQEVHWQMKCYTTITQHHLIHSGMWVWTSSMGGQQGNARSRVLLLTSLNLMHQSNTAVRCQQLSPYKSFMNEWMVFGFKPYRA